MCKKLLFRLILVMIVPLPGNGQDYIVTWNNDTVPCRMVQHPRKEGIRPTWKYTSGFYNTVAVFKEDSLRVIEPGTIKAYYREKHGKSFLCNGIFESVLVTKEEANIINEPGKRGDSAWFFINEIVKGEFASLFILYDSRANSTRRFYFLKKHIEPAFRTRIIYTRKELVETLNDDDIAAQMSTVKFRKTKFYRIVEKYNEFKKGNRQ